MKETSFASRMKNRVLFIMHMPPPIHGAAMMGQYIHDSNLINESFECRYINESSSKTIDEVGGKYFKKVFRFIWHLYDILSTLRSFKPDLVYITPSGSNPKFGMIKFVFEFSFHGFNQIQNTEAYRCANNLSFLVVNVKW